MKKIVKLVSLVLLVTICMASSVYAALSSKVTVEAEKKELSKNEEFVVYVKIADIQSERGVISLGATLEYDKDSLELVKMEGQNNWETPQAGFSYNESNGKIVITRNGFAKENENVLKLTFKMKESAKENVTITVKDITVADGKEPAQVDATTTTVTLKKDNTGTDNNKPTETPDNGNNTEKPDVTPGTDNNKPNTDNTNNPIQVPNENNSNNSNNASNKDNTVQNGKLPKTGEANFILIAGIGIAMIFATGFFIKLKSEK